MPSCAACLIWHVVVHQTDQSRKLSETQLEISRETHYFLLPRTVEDMRFLPRRTMCISCALQSSSSRHRAATARLRGDGVPVPGAHIVVDGPPPVLRHVVLAHVLHAVQRIL